MIYYDTTEVTFRVYFTPNVNETSELTSMTFTSENEGTVLTYAGVYFKDSIGVYSDITTLDLGLAENEEYIFRAYAGIKEVYKTKLFSSSFENYREYLGGSFTETDTTNDFITLD